MLKSQFEPTALHGRKQRHSVRECPPLWEAFREGEVSQRQSWDGMRGKSNCPCQNPCFCQENKILSSAPVTLCLGCRSCHSDSSPGSENTKVLLKVLS